LTRSPDAIPPDLADRVLDALADPVVAIDRTGTIVRWTPAAEKLLGVPNGKAVGQRLTTIFQGLIRNDPIEVSTLGGAEKLDSVHRLGESGPLIAVSATPLRDAQGEVAGTVAMIRAMGGWLDPVERAGRPRRQWHRTLGAIVQDLVEGAAEDPSAMDASEALARVLVGQARALLPGAECLLAVVPRERQERFQVVAGAGPWAEAQVGTDWPRTGTLAGRTLQDGRALESTRLRELGEPIEALAKSGMQTGRLVPLWSARPLPDGRQALGVLAFYRRARAYFTPYERRLIAEFARLVTLSLQRAELLRSAGEAASRLETGVDVAVELAVTLEPEEVIARLVRRAAASVEADRAMLLEIEGTEAIVMEAFDQVSGKRATAGDRFPISDLLSGGKPVVQQAVDERQPGMSGSYRVVGRPAVSEWGQAGLRHTLTLPLVLGGSVTAVLLVSRRHDQPFRREDALTLQLVGNVAALALRNARLFVEAQEAHKARSDFLNMAGHELRTPLTVIKGYLSMLSDGSLGQPPAGLRQPIELLAGKADELGTLVDDLLFTSRLDSGRLPAHPMRLDLRIAVQDAARRADPRVHLLGGDLEIEVGGDEALVVSADPEHVARVLDNLVNNALTYRRPGQPAWVRLTAGIEDGMAVVAVEDRGRGVPPELRDRIFERFVRGDQGSSGAPGTGLGLYISRQLATRHGGKLELDRSTPGQGSRFSLRLPRAAVT